MNRALIMAALCVSLAVPASAQMMEKKRSAMMAPSMEQCRGGYQKDYRTSMN